ncbi:MAG: winged helix-turn-helix transcriptional regulator [Kiritimatiellae bacterium]|nr:winged helix-turn-helix transcriptional regulator [Kiritimatiellia bacterium]
MFPEGYLFEDFEDIFSKVFGRAAQRKRRLLSILADGPKTVSGVASRLGVDRSGTLAEELKELDTAGFVTTDKGLNPETGRPALEVRYRIKDCYTRFYLHYVEPVRERVEKGLFSLSSPESMPGWDAMLGLQFETLVLNNFQELLPLMGLAHANILSAGPYVRRGRRGEGCQMDLLVQTEFMAWAVEVKRRKSIGVGIIDEVSGKLKRFPIRDGVTLRKALVYEGELATSVVERGYFDALIPAKKLLGL